MENRERKNVYQVYDKIAGWFSKNRDGGLIEKKYLDKLIRLIPANTEILDVGCGNGKPILEYLIHSGFNVTGVDASEKMLDLARINFPDTTFVLEDMRKLHLAKKFHAIIAWHSFFHLPATDQASMFSIFADHLQVNGVLLFTSGNEDGEAWGFIGGEHLHHASLNADSYQSILSANNFTVLEHCVNDESCGGATVWMVKYIP